MIPLSITITPDLANNPWTDLKKETVTRGMGTITRIGRLTNGTTSGKSTVSIVVTLDDGTEVLAQTTLSLMANAVAALCRADASQ